MCVAAIPAALAIAQAGAAYVGARGEASATNAYYRQNRAAAVTAGNDRYAAINNNTLQEREAASQELFQKQIEAMKTRATATVAAGESGVTGLSVDALTLLMRPSALPDTHFSLGERVHPARHTWRAVRIEYAADALGVDGMGFGATVPRRSRCGRLQPERNQAEQLGLRAA